MAKRYAKIPFQNSPSTTTPLSAAFLNPILNALDACDTELENKFAIASIVQTTAAANTDKVPSAAVTKNLQDQITAQNNNLSGFKSASLVDGTASNAKAVVVNKWSLLTTGTSYIVKLQDANYTYMALIQCAGPSHGACIIIGFTVGAPIYGKLDTGVWTWT